MNTISEKYKKPGLIDLVNYSTVGGGCSPGGDVPTNCASGNSATGDCNPVGQSASGNCSTTGNSAGGDCNTGDSAVHNCDSGGATGGGGCNTGIGN